MIQTKHMHHGQHSVIFATFPAKRFFFPVSALIPATVISQPGIIKVFLISYPLSYFLQIVHSIGFMRDLLLLANVYDRPAADEYRWFEAKLPCAGKLLNLLHE